MPHINRLRINNVKYNFGTQFYDDFVMTPFCHNMLYDLANGGGKSVLLLLLLQNMLPNCTLDEKQPIEKLFRTENGSTVIHSLIEWRLNDYDIKEGFRYMTTGFCARKASGNVEEGLKDTAGIEYFNYCIFYREYNDNDIRNLPLVKDKERITYTGLKKYLKELEHTAGLIVKVFDRKGEYQRFIAGYGLYESEWEIVRGINRTEGHVRTYFETNYKTTRKVVEDLFIEGIIQKSFLARTEQDQDNSKMADTLLNIKDKLLELSAKKSDIIKYDRQIEIIDGFAQRIQSFSHVYKEKQEIEQEIVRAWKKTNRLLADAKEEKECFAGEQEKLAKQCLQLEKSIAVVKYQQEKQTLKDVEEQWEKTSEEEKALAGKLKEKREYLFLQQSTNEYLDYLEEKKNRDEIKAAISHMESGNDDLLQRLRILAYNKKKRDKEELMRLESDEKKAECTEHFYEKQYKDFNEEERKLDREDAVHGNDTVRLEREMKELTEQITFYRKKVNLLFIENTDETIKERQQQLKQAERKLEEADRSFFEGLNKLSGLQMELFRLKSLKEKEEEERRRNFEKLEEYEKKRNKLNKLLNIYGASDETELHREIADRMEQAMAAIIDLKRKLPELDRYLQQSGNAGSFTGDKELEEAAKLIGRGNMDNILYGFEYIEGIEPEQRKKLLDRIPVLPYAVIVKGDFSSIKENGVLITERLGKHIIPVISMKAVESEEFAVSEQEILFFTGDKKIFIHPELKEEEKQQKKQEREEKRQELRRLSDRQNTYFADMEFLSEFQKEYGKNRAMPYDMLSEKKEDIIQLSKEIQSLCEKIDQHQKEMEKLRSGKENTAKERKELTLEIGNLKELKKIYEHFLEKENLEKQSVISESLLKEKKKEIVSKKEEADSKRKFALQKIDFCQKRKTEIKENWEKCYSSYYVPGCFEELSINGEELETEFAGLIQAFEKEHSSRKDKELLLRSYENSMNKSLRSISSKGISISQLEQMKREGNLFSAKESSMELIKKDCEQLKSQREIVLQRQKLENDKRNKLEGGLSHSFRLIKEKYGEFEEIHFDRDYREYLRELEDAWKKKTEEGKAVEEQAEQLKVKSEQLLGEKRNLESMIAGSGMKEAVIEKTEEDMEAPLKPSVRIFEQYEKNRKTIEKKKEEFLRCRLKTAETLKLLNAFELADELNEQVDTPDSWEETVQLIENLKEINECIRLEKSRVSNGVADMERIKENFENQCLQRCSNVKTELERFPKLSCINLDGERISVVKLSVPYVKEEFQKEKMSAYIDTIIKKADSFKESAEKLKYIRNALSLKKLFAVIVTDMNAIRLSLYKRERIKEQSRHLRYEEAVGSTGQSQGIYIQFLIAVINYITNLNSAVLNNQGLRKTIFIDNPFGAAKDTYIWEPIFELLRTNHVQLIVPARGATPAITSRFDVNYILGQRLTDSRQQTVVTDYCSRVDTSETEYIPLQYEQTSIDVELLQYN